jgi:hypothetical protein
LLRRAFAIFIILNSVFFFDKEICALQITEAVYLTGEKNLVQKENRSTSAQAQASMPTFIKEMGQ